MPFSTNLAHYHYYQTKFLHAGPFQLATCPERGWRRRSRAGAAPGWTPPAGRGAAPCPTSCGFIMWRKHDDPWTLNAPKIIYRLITDLNLQVEFASRAHTSTAAMAINADVQVQDFRTDHAFTSRGPSSGFDKWIEMWGIDRPIRHSISVASLSSILPPPRMTLPKGMFVGAWKTRTRTGQVFYAWIPPITMMEGSSARSVVGGNMWHEW